MTSMKQRLQNGEEVRVALAGALASPKVVEILGMFGDFHAVWIDQEHCGRTQGQIELLMMACRASATEGFVRVPPLDYCTIMRPMEAGACGVMVAQIRDVAQVREIVQWAKYPPRGVRGSFRANAEARYGAGSMAEHMETANRDRWLSIQIETPEAVACVDEIAAVDGVDNLFVGPGDLSATLGVPGEPMHPKCTDAQQRVAEASRKAGKSWGVLPMSSEHADFCREHGCQMFSLTSDAQSLIAGLATVKEQFATYF